MKALDRKLLRDARRLWSQVLSIAAVVACGVMAVVALRTTLRSIEISRDQYYARYRFGHVFATVERAPESLVARIRDIPGVAAAETRVVNSVTLDVEGLALPATGHMVSLPPVRTPMLNDVHIISGRYVERGRQDEALISDRFAAANGLRVGDELGAVINGRWQRLRVVGTALSPEYVYEIAPGSLFSDERLFGVIWMSREVLGPAFGMDGAFNDVSLLLAPGTSQQEVIARLDRILAPYGGIGAIDRDDQGSNQTLRDEIRQLRAISTVFPAIFLFVAAFLLHMVLSRLITTQREEIAVLKAFGYTSSAVARHFVGFAAICVAAGSVVGLALGLWVGGAYTRLYGQFFRFPILEHQPDWALSLVAVLVAGGAALLGALGAALRAARIAPAEALRPAAPASFRPLLVERLGYGHSISPAVRMILRNLERRPLRTAASVLGVSLAVSVLVTGMFSFDAATFMIDQQFRVAQREDLAVQFNSPRPVNVREELTRLDGVQHVEVYRMAPVRIRHRHHERALAVTGLEAGARLRRISDRQGAVYRVPPGGLVLTTALGERMELAVGDTVEVEFLERAGRFRHIEIAAFVDEMMGTAAYMELSALNELAGMGELVSGAHMLIDSRYEQMVFDELKAMPGVGGASSRTAMLATFERLMAESLRISTTLVVIFACVIALGVIYNGARIALSERGRELASLRVLGFTRREVTAMLFGEQGAITLLGIPVGFLIGTGFAWLLVMSFQSDRVRFPLVIGPRTWVFAAVVVVVAAMLAAAAMRRRVNRMDLVAVLKARE